MSERLPDPPSDRALEPVPRVPGTPIYRAADVRRCERELVVESPHKARELLAAAGAAAYSLLSLWHAGGFKVLVGPGHNGGDGLVVATQALRQGRSVLVYAPFNISTTPVVQSLWAEFVAAGGSLCSEAEFVRSPHPWVDALFGVGLNRPMAAAEATLLSRLGPALLALDIPSGLAADTGQVVGTAVKALATVTFLALKTGLFLGQGPRFSGKVWLADLAQAEWLQQRCNPVAERLTARQVSQWVQPVDPLRHKGCAGAVLVIGGEPPTLGAGWLCASACYKARAGKVIWALPPAHVALAALHYPDFMVVGIDDTAMGLDALLPMVDVIAIGPGLSTSARAQRLLTWVLSQAQAKPLVLDADALNLLAQAEGDALDELGKLGKLGKPGKPGKWAASASLRVMTPHPLEARRLLARVDKAALTADRLAQASVLAEYFQSVIVLKGAATIVAAPTGRAAIIDVGGPELAIAGAGDVLTGVISACLADHAAATRDGFERVCLAVMLHALAGTQLAGNASGGHLASDILGQLPAAYDALMQLQSDHTGGGDMLHWTKLIRRTQVLQ
jgi:ADP-dependent NAD(P)H-hydrate dehydratase / NAD(P)H-hydrate epimerase